MKLQMKWDRKNKIADGTLEADAEGVVKEAMKLRANKPPKKSKQQILQEEKRKMRELEMEEQRKILELQHKQELRKILIVAGFVLAFLLMMGIFKLVGIL